MQVVLDKQNVNICYDKSRKRLYQTWKGYLTVDEFVAAIDLSVEYFRQYDINTILSDTTDQAVLAKEGAEHAASVMPELIKNGLKRAAFVLPKSFFAKLAVEEFTNRTDPQLIGHFASREEAEDWLNKL
ncbi:hypothetical protein [Cesiribacter sp. SM1]|uniref:hypothetical protein n=1 Tax=Cesiribacter sp. SM1 TaxID=2861196 RepID=UPI001CD7D53A|nr:hypothetical protein [Cesiribacter sp. SM1]